MKRNRNFLNILKSIFILSLIINFGCESPYGCIEGSEKYIKESRSISGFKKIILENSANIYIYKSTADSIVVETDNNLISMITTDVNVGTLTIDNSGSICPTKLNIFIFSPNIEEIILEGSGNILTDSKYQIESMKMILNGSGNITFNNLMTGNLTSKISGSGNISISWNADSSYYSISGSGNINNINLNCRSSFSEIGGSGNIEVWATDYLNALIKGSGSGSIYYKGLPKTLIRSIKGSGEIIRK